MLGLFSSKHTRIARQEGDEEYDPTAADDEFAGADGEGPQQGPADEEEEEAEFDEAAIADEERNERTLMAGMPCCPAVKQHGLFKDLGFILNPKNPKSEGPGVLS